MTDTHTPVARVMILALTLVGCEVWDFAQNPAISFKLAARKFTISTDDEARWKSPPATFATRVDCSVAADCCKPPPGAPPGTAPFDCSQYSLSCDGGQCASSFPFELASAVDLGMHPALQGMNSKVISRLSLLSLEYTVDNQIGVNLPPVSIFVAPAGLTSAMGNPAAKLLDTVPMSVTGGPMTTTSALSPAAQQAFEAVARDVKTPFNLIASTTVTVKSGTPPPRGKVDITVTGTAIARF